MSKLRIYVGPEEQLRIFELAKVWTEGGYMYLRSDKGEVFKRHISHSPLSRVGWEKIEGETDA